MPEMFVMPFRPAFDGNTKTIPGAQAWFTLHGTNTPSPVYTASGLGVAHPNPLVANGVGRWPVAYLDPAITAGSGYRVRIYDDAAVVGVDTPLEEYDPYTGAEQGSKGDPGSPGEGYATRAAMQAAAASATNGDDFYETETNGRWVFRSGNYSAQVTADTAGGVFRQAGAISTATGALVRQMHVFDKIDPRWFGWTLGVGTAAVNAAAWLAMVSCVNSMAYVEAATYQGIPPIGFPIGYSETSQTWDLNFGCVRIEAPGNGQSGASLTIIKFIGCTAVRGQRFNTSGAGGAASGNHAFGDGSLIRGFELRGDYTSTEAEYHGIHMRCRLVIEGCYINGFAGDGIFADATSFGTPEGNCNNFIVRDCKIRGNRSATNITGADSNAGSFENVDVTGNRRAGVIEASFLGNNYDTIWFEANGLIPSTPPTIVTYSGNQYGVIYGQETGASTNAPSGTTAPNTWWYYIGAGGAQPGNNINTWASGTTYRSGGCLLGGGANNRSGFTDCYLEGGQGLPQLASPSYIDGGILASIRNIGTAVVRSGEGGGLAASTFVGKRAILPGGQTIRYQVGENGNDATVRLVNHPTYAPNDLRTRFGVNGFRPEDLWTDYNGTPIEILTGPTTTEQFGTGTAQPNVRHISKFALGSYSGTPRIMDVGTAAPTTGAHAQGEIVFNSGAAAAGKVGWVCTTAGTPGTWKAFGVIDA